MNVSVGGSKRPLVVLREIEEDGDQKREHFMDNIDGSDTGYCVQYKSYKRIFDDSCNKKVFVTNNLSDYSVACELVEKPSANMGQNKNSFVKSTRNDIQLGVEMTGEHSKGINKSSSSIGFSYSFLSLRCCGVE